MVHIIGTIKQRGCTIKWLARTY